MSQPKCFLYLLAASARALFGLASVSSSRAIKTSRSRLVNSVTFALPENCSSRLNQVRDGKVADRLAKHGGSLFYHCFQLGWQEEFRRASFLVAVAMIASPFLLYSDLPHRNCSRHWVECQTGANAPMRFRGIASSNLSSFTTKRPRSHKLSRIGGGLLGDSSVQRPHIMFAGDRFLEIAVQVAVVEKLLHLLFC